MYRKYHKLYDEHHITNYVPRKDRPTRDSLYNSNQSSFHYTFAPSVPVQLKDFNTKEDQSELSHHEPMEMIEHLSYRESAPTESRDDNSARCAYHSRPNSHREAPPLEEIVYSSPSIHSQKASSRCRFEENPRKIGRYPCLRQSVKEAEYLPSHGHSVKRAEYFSYPNSLNMRYEHTQPWRDIKCSSLVPAGDQILSPPRLSRQRSRDGRDVRRRVLEKNKTHKNSAIVYPTQTYHRLTNKPRPLMHSYIDYRIFCHSYIGDPSLGIHRLRLPKELLRLLDHSKYSINHSIL